MTLLMRQSRRLHSHHGQCVGIGNGLPASPVWMIMVQVQGDRVAWAGHSRGLSIVKLAEALSLRASALRRIEQLRARIASSARYQEGEEPAEDAAALLAEVDGVLD